MTSLIITDITEINHKNYPTIYDLIKNALINNHIKHHTSDHYYSDIFGQNLTNNRRDAIQNLRDADNNDPGTEYALDHYEARKKHFIHVQGKINQLKHDIISRLTAAAKGTLYNQFSNPTLPQLLDYLYSKYGTITPSQRVELKSKLGNIIRWPTCTAEIQLCIDELQLRYTEYHKLVHPNADAATKEAIQIEGLIEAIEHFVASRPDMIHLIRDRPEIFDSTYLFTLINNNMRNSDFKQIPISKALIVKQNAKEEKGKQSKENNKYCFKHGWNSNHEATNCFFIATWIQGLKDSELKHLQRLELPYKKKGKQQKAKIASKKEMLDDSDSDD